MYFIVYNCKKKKGVGGASVLANDLLKVFGVIFETGNNIIGGVPPINVDGD